MLEEPQTSFCGCLLIDLILLKHALLIPNSSFLIEDILFVGC